MYHLSYKLIEKLNKRSIKYCHWKSNLLLNEALGGYDDLDFLVAREDIYRFEILIKSLGFKEASNRNISFYGIKHFYGFDIDSGNILHLHIYYQIKSGESWSKPIHFNFEDYILNNLTLHSSGILIPQKHIELAIFVFRVMLKYSKIHEAILVGREHSRTIREIEYLQDGLNRDKLREFLKRFFPNISLDEFYGLLDVIKNGSNLKRYILGKKVSYKLSSYRYLSPFEEFRLNLYQFIYRVLNRLFFKEKKRLSSMGSMIVVTGADATGKSTVTKDLKNWLGENFTTYHIHFGRPPSTLLTFPINILIRLLKKRGYGCKSTKFSTQKGSSKKSLIYMVRQLALAYDRYVQIRKYYRFVSKGDILIVDRYKSENYYVMDSPRLNPKDYRGIKRKIALLEKSLYSKMPIPDILFTLTVPVEVAVERNRTRVKEGKESEEFIRIRHKENKNLDYRAKYLYKIDTDVPYEMELREIKAKVWRLL
jgi:thymidylate kinase